MRNDELRTGAAARVRVSPTERDRDEILLAVAEPSRLRILNALLARREATQTSLAAELPLTRQAVAQHLAALERAGLVTASPVGRETRYAVSAGKLREATSAMAEQAASRRRRLRAIERQATLRGTCARRARYRRAALG